MPKNMIRANMEVKTRIRQPLQNNLVGQKQPNPIKKKRLINRQPKGSPPKTTNEDTIDIIVTNNRKTKGRVQIQPLDSFGDVKPNSNRR